MTFTDFESVNWATPDWDQGPGWDNETNYNITVYDVPVPNPFAIKRKADPTGIKNQVLYWPISKGRHSVGRYESKTIDSREAWAEYKIYIPDSVRYDIGENQDDSNKLPGFTGGGRGSGNYGQDDGKHGWSARTGWKVDADGTFRIGYDIYHMDRPAGQAGEWASWKHTLERNRWYKITEHVKANTLGVNGANADGVLEAWVDDEKVFSQNDYRFSAIPDYTNVRAFWLTVYFGGNEKAPDTMGFYFDDLSVYRVPDPPAAVLNSVYPNPARSTHTVKLALTVNETGPYDVRVTSLDGSTVIYEKSGLFEKGEHTLSFQPERSLRETHVPWLTFGSFLSGSTGSERILNRSEIDYSSLNGSTQL